MDSGANFMHWLSVLPMEKDVIEALFYLTDFMNYNNLTHGHLFPHILWAFDASNSKKYIITIILHNVTFSDKNKVIFFIKLIIFIFDILRLLVLC